MYADKVTKSMQACLDETERRRIKQLAHNKKHGIIPKSIVKPMRSILDDITSSEVDDLPLIMEDEAEYSNPAGLKRLIAQKKQEMLAAAADLDFEKAATLRDQMLILEKRELALR